MDTPQLSNVCFRQKRPRMDSPSDVEGTENLSDNEVPATGRELPICTDPLLPEMNSSTDIKATQSISSKCLDAFTSNLQTTLSLWRSELNKDLFQIRDEIKCTMADIRNEISTLFNQQKLLKNTVAEMRADVVNLQASIVDQAEQHDALKQRIDELNHTGPADMQLTIDTLESKIDNMEQQARQCNVEIGNLPERRNENLPALVEAIGHALKCPILPQNIVAVHRVPHAHQQNKKPKNIIVKLSSCLHRDNLLSAYRKAPLLKTDDIGLNATSSSIYLNEHLTLKKKLLFRKVRECAKKNNFKFTWIRNGTILVREREGATAFAVRGDRDLSRIKSNSPN